MEQNSSKFKFLVVILCAIFQMPGGSEEASIDRDFCGLTVVKDPGPGHEEAERVMPWVVGIYAGDAYEYRECTGSIISEHLVLTSKYCPLNRPEDAEYVIDLDFGRLEPVTKVHLIKQTALMVLEVSSPFRSDFTVCLSHTLNTAHLNNTLWSASWVIGYPGSIADGLLYREQWTLASAKTPCNATCRTAPSDRCTCALSVVDKWRPCRADEGKAVMRWNGKKWYMVGVVTEAQNGGGQCPSSPEQFYQKILPEDVLNIGLIHDPGLIGPQKTKVKQKDLKDMMEAVALRPRYCGRADFLHLGLLKEVAPTFLPWVVAVRAVLGTRILQCAGAIIEIDRVLTAARCYPKAFRSATYKVINGSMDLSYGTEIDVVEVITHTYLGPSFVVLVLASMVDGRSRICLPTAPYFLQGKNVVAASWAFNDVGGQFKKGMLYYEKWLFPEDRRFCDGESFTHRGPLGEHRMCSIAGTDTYYACQGQLGQPVMRWEEGQWYLVGMVTHVHKGQKDCELRRSRKRVFEWISRWTWENDKPRSLTGDY